MAITGSSFGLALEYIGVPSPEGRSDCDALIAVWMSCAAESILRLLWNTSTTTLLLSELEERMRSTPAIGPGDVPAVR